MPLPKDLLDIMACPLCRADLREEGESLKCARPECGLVFAVKDGIPVMLIDEAQRPCPKCSAQRDWKSDALSCPKCGTSFAPERK